MNIRRAELNDLQQVYEVEHSAFGGGYTYGTIRQYHDLFGDLLYVAEHDDGRIVGYVLGGIPSTDSSVAWVLTLAVHSDYQQSGVGTALMDAILAVMRARGCRRILLTVHPSKSHVIAFYQKLGFVIEAQVADYFGEGNPRNIMVYTLPA